MVCLFYVLVITAMLIQIYTPDHISLMALFGVIAGMSSIFIILEISQLSNHPRRYYSLLLYNSVDIAAFALPLAGCINQFKIGSSINNQNDLEPRGPYPWFFSFSILFIALHLLFELRVNKDVCQFVTIIVQIFGKIKIFFVIFL
ncbi:hypothetical protein BGZ83_002554, partial [Gryganskiella cystojenkinii]